MAKREDRYKNSYSDRGFHDYKDDRTYAANDLDGTQVFNAVSKNESNATRPKKRNIGYKTGTSSNLASINLSLTIIIAALLICLVLLLAIYYRVNA